MANTGSNGMSRRRLLTTAAGVTAVAFGSLASPTPAFAAPLQQQVGWRFCNRCFGLVLPWGANNACPAGGVHTPQGWVFKLPFNSGPGGSGEDAHNQGNWWQCKLCSVLFWSSPTSYVAGRCPTGDRHDAIDNNLNIGLHYLLPHDIGNPPGTQRWRFCFRCHSLFFEGYNPNLGRCPAGGGHAAAGFLFAIPVHSY